jgi:hypothetical protein
VREQPRKTFPTSFEPRPRSSFMSSQSLVLISRPPAKPQVYSDQEPFQRLRIECTVVIHPSPDHRVYAPRQFGQRQ